MLDEATAIEVMPSASAWTADDRDRHGMVAALVIAEERGDDAAAAWYREHEALPRHRSGQCPMIKAILEGAKATAEAA